MHDASNASAAPELRRAAWRVVVAATVETSLTIAHFLYGADIYDDPSRDHVVVPVLVSLGLATGLSALFTSRPSPVTLWSFVAVVTLPFVGIFGLYHGGFNHVCKLAWFAAGTSPERLEQMFDSPDYALPNDALFEVSGTSTLMAGLLVACLLVRLLGTGKRAHNLGAAVASTSTAQRA